MSQTFQQTLIGCAFALSLAVIAIVASGAEQAPQPDPQQSTPRAAAPMPRPTDGGSSQVASNEQRAEAMMRILAAAQAQFRAIGAIDTDGDDEGEYGYLGELSGQSTLRRGDPVEGPPVRLEPPFLSPAVASIEEDALGHGVMVHRGYAFKIYLPATPDGDLVAGIGEAPRGGTPRTDAWASDACEQHWCAYAWPLAADAGTKMFFMNEAGDLLARDCGETVGLDHPPAFSAAFGDDPRGMAGTCGWAVR